MEKVATQKQRLDQFVAEAAQISRSQAKEIIEKGLVKVNGKTVQKPAYKVKEGERVEFEVPEPEPIEVKPEAIPLEVIYEDQDVIVINKPAGMVVHPAPGHYSGTLVNALLHHCKDLGGIGGALRPGIVHRLDKDTAGLIVVAKNDLAQQSLIEQFKNRSVGRFYRALIYGIPKREHDRIVLPIGRDKFDRKKFSPNTTSPKEAITNYWVIEKFPEHNVAEIKCKLETGRTHQIRVHMSNLGHPLLGDRTYGYKPSRIEDEKLRRLIDEMGMHALCAYYLAFDHPRTGKRMEFEVELPKGYQRVLNYLKGFYSTE
ncbi:RluA family pseudouridine synthase [Thermovibrio ammonificans]|uniref:Pseudouridine synthase n=1 Tax=Thermovibrio ammonificans (strain DSM 15698 / JCM 12110 / HB-1) TaxID=648996 RepID=E8T4T0_THEA1|nr:RluA family pseudouridine synthase [Thermovibrio ammonificans]ADU96342.1 pseudouridine synthase, RluA family [Thermovibrio ammonificans HB-1]